MSASGPVANPLRDSFVHPAASSSPARRARSLMRAVVSSDDALDGVTVTLDQCLSANVVETATALGLSWSEGGKPSTCGTLVMGLHFLWLCVGCLVLSVAVRTSLGLRVGSECVGSECVERGPPGGGPGSPEIDTAQRFEREPPGTALMRFYVFAVLFAVPVFFRLHLLRSFGPGRPYRDLVLSQQQSGEEAEKADADGGGKSISSDLVDDVRADILAKGVAFYLPVLFGVLVTIGPISAVLRDLADGKQAQKTNTSLTAANGTVVWEMRERREMPAMDASVVPVLIVSSLWAVVVCPLTSVAVQLQLVVQLHLAQLNAFIDGVASARLADASAAVKEFRLFREELDRTSRYWQNVWLVLLAACGMGVLTVYANLEAIKHNTAVAEAAGDDLAIDRQVSVSIENLTTGGLPVQLFATVLLFCLLSVAQVNRSIESIPQQLCEISAFGSAQEGAVQRHNLINELQWLGAGWRIAGWHVSDGTLAATALSVLLPIAISLRDALQEVGEATPDTA